MGYRTYLGIMKKDQLNEILACQTEEDLLSVYQKNGWGAEKDEYDGKTHYYFPVSRLGYRATFEFGKYADLGEDFDSKRHEIFSKEHPLFKYFDGNDFWYGGEDLFLAAIENYRCKVRDYFNGLLKKEPSKEDSYDYFKYNHLSDSEKEQWQYNRVMMALCDKAYEWSDEKCNGWELLPYNLNKDNKAIISSWLYEYEIFELVRIYKTFDPETEVLIYYGW